MVDQEPGVTSRVINTRTAIGLVQEERDSRSAWESFLPDVRADIVVGVHNQMVWMLENPDLWVPSALTKLERIGADHLQFTISFHVDVTASRGRELTQSGADHSAWLKAELLRVQESLRERERLGADDAVPHQGGEAPRS